MHNCISTRERQASNKTDDRRILRDSTKQNRFKTTVSDISQQSDICTCGIISYHIVSIDQSNRGPLRHVRQRRKQKHIKNEERDSNEKNDAMMQAI